MNIVHIVYEIPLPHGSGGDLRNRAVHSALSALAARGTINMVSVQSLCRARKVNPARKTSHIEASVPIAILDEIADHVAKQAPDLVVVDGVFLADISHRLTADGFRVVVNMHNIESALLVEIDRAKRKWFARKRQQARWAQAAIADRKLARAVADVWVCSPQDAAVLRTIAGEKTNVSVVANPMPEWCVAARPLPRADIAPVRALFVAHLGWPPNIQAAVRLIDHLQPAIAKQFDGATLTMCGRSPSSKLIKRASKRADIRVVGDPKNLAPIYAQANVALIPLSEGGGTRLKVIEAMAMGLPVIATRKAVEGIDIAPEEGFLLAETDDDFVQALARLTADADLRARLIETARDFAFARHGPAVIEGQVRKAAAQAGT